MSADGRAGRLALAVTFAGAARRYWLGVFPSVRRERRRRRARALEIPDPRLRATALESQRKWGNVEGAAAFAAFVPRRRRAAAARAMMSFQAAYNYLDLLGEQPSEDPAANGRQLHAALLCALDPGAGAHLRDGDGRDREHGEDGAHLDYYAHNPQREDGGYLRELVEDCRMALRELPSYGALAPAARAAARRIVEFQSANTGERQGDLAALERWARAVNPVGEELRWWEVAAAGGSSLCVFALIALAAEPALDSRAVGAVVDAYWPWIGALHSLLDNLVDVEEDRATVQHSLVGRYASPREAAARMSALAERSQRAARSLPGDARSHELVLAAMASFYLSMPQARAPAARPVAEALLRTLDGTVRAAMLVFRLRRGLAREVDSPAVGSRGAPRGQRLPV